MSERVISVTRIQKFCTQDGPGVRTTVFLKGCPLRCRWCHNPETQSAAPQLLYARGLCSLCGACASVCPRQAHELTAREHAFYAERCAGCGECAAICPSGACEMASRPMSVSRIIEAVARDRAFYGARGGMTLSGGEPMFEPENCLALLRAAREAKIGTAIETCGFFDGGRIEELASLTDVFLWDFKESDPQRHLEYTGRSNELILSNLRALDRFPVVIRLRCLLVSGVNLNQLHLEAVARLYHSLTHCDGVDLLPYHAYGASKAAQLGRGETARRDWIPSEDQMKRAEAFLAAQGVRVVRMG